MQVRVTEANNFTEGEMRVFDIGKRGVNNGKETKRVEI